MVSKNSTDYSLIIFCGVLPTQYYILLAAHNHDYTCQAWQVWGMSYPQTGQDVSLHALGYMYFETWCYHGYCKYFTKSCDNDHLIQHLKKILRS